MKNCRYRLRSPGEVYGYRASLEIGQLKKWFSDSVQPLCARHSNAAPSLDAYILGAVTALEEATNQGAPLGEGDMETLNKLLRFWAATMSLSFEPGLNHWFPSHLEQYEEEI